MRSVRILAALFAVGMAYSTQAAGAGAGAAMVFRGSGTCS